MMEKCRGFSVVALHNPQKAENVGAVLRAASCYGVSQVNIGGTSKKSWLGHATNTPKAHRHMPVFVMADALSPRPHDVQVVAVDLVPEARSLVDFVHPTRAMYVFGPENGTLDAAILDHAEHRVMIPTDGCMNLAACVNVVLYDRMAKMSRRKEQEGGE